MLVFELRRTERHFLSFCNFYNGHRNTFFSSQKLMLPEVQSNENGFDHVFQFDQFGSNDKLNEPYIFR